jgi:hypothetical protein
VDDRKRADDQLEPEPNFARGLSDELEPGTEDHGSFSEGQEQAPEADPEGEPNFARGVSGEPEPGTEEHGRFSDGQEQHRKGAEHRARRRPDERAPLRR